MINFIFIARSFFVCVLTRKIIYTHTIDQENFFACLLDHQLSHSVVDRESLFPNYALRLSDGSENSLYAAFCELYTERVLRIFCSLIVLEGMASYEGQLLAL